MRQVFGALFGRGDPAPNAALDVARNEVSGVLALELSAPRYNRRRRVLSYRVRPLRTLRKTKLAYLESKRRRASIPRHFRAASLFLDDGRAATSQPLENFTQANFDYAVLARSSSEPVVVAFTADWSGPSRAYLPALVATANARAGTTAIGTVDVDTNPSLSQAYEVTRIPTTLVIRNGEVVDRWQGPLPASAIAQRLNAPPDG